MTEEQEPQEDAVDWARMESETTGGEPQWQHLTPEMLARRLLWDIAPCQMAAEVAAFMGLPPASQEIEEMEHTQSHQRLAASGPVVPFIGELTKYATHAVVGATIMSSEEQVDEDERQHVVERLYPMIYQSTLAVVAELIDIGAIHLPHFRMVPLDV